MKNLKEQIKQESKNIFNQLKRIFTKEHIILIIIMVISGLIIHFELIARDVSNPDTLLSGYNYIANGWEVSLGRWFHVIISKLRFGLSTPMYSTFISLCITAIATIFIIDLFEIKSKIGKALCAFLLITIPPFTATLTYFYCSDIYQIALLCAVLMPWCIYKLKNKKLGIIFGAIFLTISLASYQSYLGVSCGICVIVWILKLLKDTSYTIKDLGKDILVAVVAAIIGFILYAIISKVFLWIYNMDIASYSGANSISLINTILNLPNSILETYKSFYEIFFENAIVKNSSYYRQILYALTFILIFITLIYKLIRSKKRSNSIVAIILTLLLPIAFNVILLIATERQMSTIMTTAMFFIILYLISLLEICKINWNKILSYIIIAIIIYTYILSINATYISIDLTKEQTMQIAERILQSIESLDGYTTDMQVCIVGVIDDENFPKQDTIYDMSIGMVSDFGYFWNDSYEIAISCWQKLYETYFGYNINLCDESSYNIIIQTQDFTEMSIYPNDNSIKIINGIIVIKLTDTPI